MKLKDFKKPGYRWLYWLERGWDLDKSSTPRTVIDHELETFRRARDLEAELMEVFDEFYDIGQHNSDVLDLINKEEYEDLDQAEEKIRFRIELWREYYL